MRNVLVVGCGLTGSTVVHLLRAVASQLNVHVWDKGARPGGRFTTFIDRATGATCDMVSSSSSSFFLQQHRNSSCFTRCPCPVRLTDSLVWTPAY